MIGYDADLMIGDNALEYVAPEHFEPMMFVFAGPGDHVVRDRHAPFPLDLIGSDGERLTVDCAAHRIRHEGRLLWVVTMMPHQLQSASFHALIAYGRGESAHDVGATIAERLSWQWDPVAEIRSFLLSDPVDGTFTEVSEPGQIHRSPQLLDALRRQIGERGTVECRARRNPCHRARGRSSDFDCTGRTRFGLRGCLHRHRPARRRGAARARLVRDSSVRLRGQPRHDHG